MTISVLMRVFSLAVFLLVGASARVLADEVSSRYVREKSGSDTVIVFVHGVLGEGVSTWTNGHAYWPTMLAADSTFDGADIFVYSYPTSMWATLSIDELAENMRLLLNANGVANHRRVVFLSHSMGGLVTRAYLLKNRDVAARTAFAYFYSTPTAGSQIADLATIISRNPQFSKMKPMNAADYLADLLRQWLAADLKIPSYCAYEKQSTYGLAIVTFQSASALCTKPIDPIDADHINIVKPSSETSVAYLAFKAAFRQQMASLRPSAAIIEQFERILSSLHRTQMTKAENLSPRIEEYIRNPSEANWRIVQSTSRVFIDEIQAAANMAMAFDAQFYEQGQNIILIATGTRETVDRSFNQPFRTTRQEWNGRIFVLKEIIQVENRPTPAQVREWAGNLQQRYNHLDDEMMRLLELIRQRT